MLYFFILGNQECYGNGYDKLSIVNTNLDYYRAVICELLDLSESTVVLSM